LFRDVADGQARRPRATLDDCVLDLETQPGKATEQLVAKPAPQRVCAVQIRRQRVVAEEDKVHVVGERNLVDALIGQPFPQARQLSSNEPAVDHRAPAALI
jgi:hypothetical protein